MSNLKTAKSFIKNYLPEKIVKLIKLENIIIEKDSFIEAELSEVFSDILYKVNLAGRDAYLYFLFEHKSFPEPRISLQLLKYMIKIWEQKIKQNQANDLPLIIPLVIYHGKTNWNIDLRLSGILQTIPVELEEYIPDYKYLIYDLSSYDNQDIKGEVRLRIFFELVTAIYQGDFGTRFKKALKILEELKDKTTVMEYFKTMLTYSINVQEDLNAQKLSQLAGEISQERSDQIMSIAEQLKEEGRQEGKQEGMVELVEKLLFRKFKSVPNKYREKLREQDKTKLEIIATEILEMEDIEELKDYLN